MTIGTAHPSFAALLDQMGKSKEATKLREEAILFSMSGKNRSLVEQKISSGSSVNFASTTGTVRDMRFMREILQSEL
jgi:hypothetical protein